jgi:hypothetical protein
MQDTNDLLEDVLAGKIELESVAEPHIRKLLRRFRQVVHHLLLDRHRLPPNRKPKESKVKIGIQIKTY